jgi:hypothetical protein
MYKKQNGLEVNSENREKSYMVEIKIVSLALTGRVAGKKGGEKCG